MERATHNALGRWIAPWIDWRIGCWMRKAAGLAAVCALMAGHGWALQAGAAQSGTPQVGDAAKAATAPGQGVVLDRVVALVNGDLILESDVDAERRFELIQPYLSGRTDFSRTRTVERLVDRTLIEQQAALEPETAVNDTELNAQIARLRKDIPECKQYHCETEDGWAKFLADHGFTVQEFRERWRQRMVLLKFIEIRFRSGVTISDDQIKAYYDTTMLPEYARRHVTPPPLDTISKRVEEVLLQQQVSALLRDWLTSLRAQGSVRIMSPGEAAS